MPEEDENKVFVSVKGGTEEERKSIRDRFKDLSQSGEVDIDLVNVDGENTDLSVDIKSPCGDVCLKKGDIVGKEGVLDSALQKVRCNAQPTVAEVPPETAAADHIAQSTDTVDDVDRQPEPTADASTPESPQKEEKDVVQGDLDTEE